MRFLAALPLVCTLAFATACAPVEVSPRLEAGQLPEVAGPVADFWAPPVTIRTDNQHYAAPIHVSLQPNGDVLFIGVTREFPDVENPGETGDFYAVMTPGAIPPTGEVTLVNDELSVPVELRGDLVDGFVQSDTLYCSGHTLLEDGTFFAAGGIRIAYDADETHMIGLPYAMTYGGNTWSRDPNYMLGVGDGLPWPVRWYPTATRLKDSRVLVTGGRDYVLGWYIDETGTPVQIFPDAKNLSVEVYDPNATGSPWTLLSEHAASPWQLFNADYSHVFQMPTPHNGRDVLMVGQYGYPVFFNPADGSFEVSPQQRQGGGADPNHGASTALLPMRLVNGEWGYNNGSVLVAGGAHGSVAEESADVYDPVADSWSVHIDTTVGRHHPSTVLLPDGRILIAAGHNDHDPAAPGKAHYVDPANGFVLTEGTSSYAETRGYHTFSALLPDGRVILGGGNDDGAAGKEKSDFRYLYPSYMFDPLRPAIGDLPDPQLVGGTWNVAITYSFEPITEVVLMGLGSMTHSFDFNQRYVQVPAVSFPIAGTNWSYTYFLPPTDRALAPAGHYMVFALDGSRRPTQGWIGQLQ